MFFPNIAYASFDSFLTNVNNMIVNPIIEVMFAVALVFFLWGVVEFMMNQQNDEKRTQGKMHMLWGIVGIAIMFGVFAIMNLIINTLGVDGIDPVNNTVDLN